MAAPIEVVQDNITKKLQSMITKSRDPRPFYEKVYKSYLIAQAQRFKTQNSDRDISPGPVWPELDKVYAKRKLTKYASFPGGGTKMMIATGTMAQAFTGQNNHIMKAISNRGLIVAVDLPYAKYTNVRRDLSQFSRAWTDGLKSDFKIYMKGGE